MTRSPASAAPEYRRYRRFLAWLVLGLVSVGAAFLVLGIGVSIYRQRHVNPPGGPIGALATPGEMQGCQDELSDVTHGLGKHLESFHRLLDHYDRAKAQEWGDQGARWRNEWKSVARRCRFTELRGGKLSKELENMATVHAELGEIEADYSRELRRFGERDAPRLDRVRERLEKIGERLGQAQEKESETK